MNVQDPFQLNGAELSLIEVFVWTSGGKNAHREVYHTDYHCKKLSLHGANRVFYHIDHISPSLRLCKACAGTSREHKSHNTDYSHFESLCRAAGLSPAEVRVANVR